MKIKCVSSLFLLIIMVSSHSLYAETDLKKLKQTVSAKFPPGIKLEKIRKSPIAGLYEVEYKSQVGYVTEDGKYLLTGDLINLNTKENISENKRKKILISLLDDVGDSNMLLFNPKNMKRTVTVFTDVDCTYCARFHLEVPALNKAGVKVRYLFYPRSGVGENSKSYKRAVSVWCADDPAKAIGVAKARGKLEPKTCNNPVKDHFALGNQVGVTGTPTIFFDDGTKLGGYLPADRLLSALGLK